MLKSCKNLLIAAMVIALAVLHGCGAGIAKTVEAAELPGSPFAISVHSASSVPSVQLTTGAVRANGAVGESVHVQIQAAGGKGPYKWAVKSGSLPTGVKLRANGVIVGSFAAAGTWSSTLEVSDSSQPAKVEEQPATFEVSRAQLAIDATNLASGKKGSAYSARLNAAGGAPKYSWALASGDLPAGLSLSSDGVISGTPSSAGAKKFTVRVEDSSSPAKASIDALSIMVVDTNLSITSTGINDAQQGSGYTTALRATGGSGQYVWRLTAGTLPTGLRFATTGVISGTPTTTGTSTFTVTVHDAQERSQHVSAPLLLKVVAAASPLKITTANLAGATSGSSYSGALAASGGTPAYSWAIASGTLPSGLSLSNSGVISGTPSTTGTFNFTAAVTDAGSPAQQTTKPLSIKIATASLAINTGALSGAQTTVAYAAQLSATGGTPGYTWTIASGSLPSGLSLQRTTGAILGTPSSTGSSSFTYRVSDSGKPQQSVSASATISVSAAPVSSAGNTWFIRPDGGNRYDGSLYTLGQCDGKADAPYPGKGYNQHCAFADLRYMWMVGTYGNSGWVMQGGDTLVIRGCSALPSQQHADAPHCRIGWDKATGNDSENFWGAGVSAWWGLSMPPPPSGTATQHTRILGACAYGTYTCNPVIGYPYTNNNLTQLYGSFGSTVAILLNGSKYVDLEGLEITTHNGKCARYGTTNPLPGCNRGGSYPLSDQADQGIVTDSTTSGILLQDLYIHGFSSNGITGPIGGKIIANRVNVSFNTFAGWNFDDGKPTNNGPGSSLEQHYVTMVGNGCQEEYPIVHTQFPAKGCWDSSTGGFGDAWSGQNGTMDSFTCDHCYIAYNSKDGAMGPHTGIANIALTNSAWIGNMGQSGKWGQDDNATFLFQNNVLVGNCMRMSQAMPGAAQNFDSGTGLTGSGLAGYCRAAGPLFDYFSGANSNIRFDHNTIVSYQPTIFEPGCYTPGNCATSPLNFTNNIVLAYTPTYNFSPFNPGQAPGLFYKDDNSVPIVSSHNIWYGIRNDYSTCNTNGTLCTDPLLANEPGQGSIPPEWKLDNFNFHPSAGSPAVSAGIKDALTPAKDYYGASQTASPTIGAVIQ